MKKILFTATLLGAVVLFVGCGKKKWNYIDGVAYHNASNTEYASVVRSDPEYENPVIARDYEGRPVEEIDQEAFSGAVLTSIVIPDTINHISPTAFMDCPNLKEITIEGTPRLRDGCFCRLPALKIVTFGQGTENISMAVFEDCDALREIYIPAGCMEITGDVPSGVTLILQSEQLVGQALENGWDFQMEDGSEASSMALAEAIEAGKITWDSDIDIPNKKIYIHNVSGEILSVNWPGCFELESGEVTCYILKGDTVTLKPGDELQLDADYYTAYGPEETTVQVAAESEYLYCRLYKENVKLDSEFLLEPYERKTLTLPCGRYMIMTLAGKTAEEADPDVDEDAHWYSVSASDFEARASYEVSPGIRGGIGLWEIEDYGPGESGLYLKAGDRSACYRLVRVGGELEVQVLLEPNRSEMVHFPCGTYKLRIAEGDTWISDEEAFGEDGKYTAVNYFHYQEGETYEITETTGSGNIYADSAGGFGN